MWDVKLLLLNLSNSQTLEVESLFNFYSSRILLVDNAGRGVVGVQPLQLSDPRNWIAVQLDYEQIVLANSTVRLDTLARPSIRLHSYPFVNQVLHVKQLTVAN